MIVYRISHKKFSNELKASGIENRWNLAGQFVLYTSSNKALACLENLVHATGEILGNNLYVCMEIYIPDTAGIYAITLKAMPENVSAEELRARTRAIGNKWYTDIKDLLLQVPSTIIPSEHNFIINTQHQDMKKVKILSTEPFLFDSRLK